MNQVDAALETVCYPAQDAIHNLGQAGGQIARLLATKGTGQLLTVDRDQAEASIGAAALALGALAKRFGLTLEQCMETNAARVNGARSGGLQMAQTAQRQTRRVGNAS